MIVVAPPPDTSILMPPEPNARNIAGHATLVFVGRETIHFFQPLVTGHIRYICFRSWIMYLRSNARTVSASSAMLQSKYELIV